MEITEIKMQLKKEEKLKAYATITIDNCFAVRDLKVIQGNTGLFVAMPSRKKKDGSYKDIAHPLNNETRLMIENKILQKYKDALAGVEDVNIKAAPAETEAVVSIDKTMSDLEKNLESKFSNI
jgi:stage V sporulation protein G